MRGRLLTVRQLEDAFSRLPAAWAQLEGTLYRVAVREPIPKFGANTVPDHISVRTIEFKAHHGEWVLWSMPGGYADACDTDRG